MPFLSLNRGRHTRHVVLVTLSCLVCSLTVGCAQAATFALQHSVGAAVGPCRAAKDSVERAHGAPYRRHVADEEDVTTRAQIFWHEWAYRPDSAGTRPGSDSVTVVGFRSGEGVDGCDVRERRALVPGRNGRPWEGVGEVPSE
jgi:hypothetical protein